MFNRYRIILITLLFVSSLLNTAHSKTLTPPSKAIPATLFGLHVQRVVESTSFPVPTSWPTVQFATWRLWDVYAQWPWIEPRKGAWRFQRLDKMVELAESNHVQVLLPLGLTPAWASARPTERGAYQAGCAAEPQNIEDWRNYVRTVATRYKNKIKYYEIWNEPNYTSMFSGQISKLVELEREAYNIIHQIDPDAKVVSPSIGIADNAKNWSEWQKDFLDKNGYAYCDIIGLHIYTSPRPPEALLDIFDKFNLNVKKLSKPIWNTEAGWLISNRKTEVKPQKVVYTKVLTDEETAAYIVRYYILNWASGMERFYWYSWDHTEMGLTEADGRTVKFAAEAYNQAYRWLVGSKMLSCSQNLNGVWVANLLRSNNSRAFIIWHPDKSTSFQIPVTWSKLRGFKPDGSTAKISPDNKIMIGPTPILIEGTEK